MRRVLAAPALLVVCCVAWYALGCSPSLNAPRESIRVSGTVLDVVEQATPAAAATPSPTPNGLVSSTPVAGKIATPKPLRTFPTLQQMPLGVAVYEACSPQLYLFKRCPGRFLSEAKLAHPGPFVVEIDTQAAEVVLFGYRGFLGPEQQQESCAEVKISIADAGKPVTLQLQPGTCSIKLEKRYG